MTRNPASRPSAFDALAADYDRAFSASPITQHLRARVHDRLMRHLHPGDAALELGCGTGEDAARLAERGVLVTATDASEGMLTAARAKFAGMPGLSFDRLDLDALPNGFTGPYTVVYANFGVINCISPWRRIAAWLADRIAPGGRAAFGVMSPLCAWETAWCAVHGDFKTAFRRWRAFSAFQPDAQSPTVYVRYPTIARLTREFAPWFRRAHLEGLGIVLPPTAMYPLLEARPRWLERALRWDARLSTIPQLSLLADHYWIEFERIA